MNRNEIDAFWIFGAGASFGSDVDGVPPLGNRLASQLAERFTAWRSVYGDSKQLWEEDFEQEYRRRQGQTSAHTTLQLDMARFFFDLHPSPTNLYARFAGAIRSRCGCIAIATLNYDLLLQRSLRSVSCPYHCDGVVDGSGVEVVLPHGSCNLFSSSHVLLQGTELSGLLGGQINIDTGVKPFEAEDAFADKLALGVPPAMSYFEPQKRTMVGATWMSKQRERFRALCADAKTIVVVGVAHRAHDEHIWGPILTSPARVLICAGSTTTREFAALSARRSLRCFDAPWSECFDQILEEARK